MSGLWAAAARIAQKDLRIEARTGDVLVTTGLFSVLLCILASLSLYFDRQSARQVAAGVLWLTLAFGGLVALGRSWARERERDMIKALLLAPIPRAAIYLGKGASGFVFLVAVELILVPLTAILFHLELGPVLPMLALLLGLGSVGFVATGTLFSLISVRSNMRDVVLSIVVFPLVAPSLLAGVVATREVLGGATADEIWDWVRILAAYDLVAVTAGISLFGALASD